MQDGGLEVVDVDLVLGDVEAEVVGFAVGAGFGAATGHQGGEGLRVVVAARRRGESRRVSKWSLRTAKAAARVGRRMWVRSWEQQGLYLV